MRKEIENKRDQMGYARVFQYELFEGIEIRTFCGLVNRNNMEVVPCKYHNILGFWNDAPLAVVEISDKYGYINKLGKEVTPICYDFADDRFYCGIASVERDGKCGFVDASGREVVACKYDNCGVFVDDLSGVACNGIYGCINTKGETIVPFRYDYLGVMGHNRICARIKGKNGLLDYTGCVIAPFEYDGISDILSDFRIEYWKGSEHGFMDLNGGNKEVLPF